MNTFNKIYYASVLSLFGLSASAQEYTGVDLTIQSIFGIITGLACWFTRFALVLMVVMIVFYGVKFMTSQGNPAKLSEAKSSFAWAIVGVLVILGTYTIIATVANFVGGDYTLIIPLNCSGF